MENCEQMLEMISASVDGQLSAEDQARLDAHLAECQSCAEKLAMFRLLHEEAGALQEDPPVKIAANVIAAVRRQSKPSVFRRFRFTTVAAIFALIVFAVSGGMERFFPTGPQDAGVPDVAAETSEYTVQSRALPQTPYGKQFRFYILVNSWDTPEFLAEAEGLKAGNRMYFKVTDAQKDSILAYYEERELPLGFYTGDAAADQGILILEE